MKSYSDSQLKTNIRPQFTLYKGTHPLFRKWMSEKHKTIVKEEVHEIILQRIGNKRSLWIDSFGHCFNSYNTNIISVEYMRVQNLLKGLPNIYCRPNLDSLTTHIELAETFDPEIVVYFKSLLLHYVTIPELVQKITEIKDVYNVPICVYLDLIYINYNKMKYPINDIVQQINEQLPNATLKRFFLTDLLINI